MTESGNLLLELGDKRTAGEGGLVQHLLDRRGDLILDRLVLGFQIQEGDLHDFSPSVIFRRTRAGFPATIVSGGTSFVTTLPAPVMARSPTVIPPSRVTLDPA